MTDAADQKPEPFDLNSDDVAARKRAELRRLFPEVFNEDKIDLEQLRRVMGDWVDEGTERFGLTWPGKSACMKVIQAPATGALRPDRDESVNFDRSENVFIEGDNLEVLKLLQKAYFGKVKLIYVDPPYNTGKEFIYPDKYAENLETYLSYTGQVDSEGRKFSTNSDSSGRFHSRWINMMFPRLYLAKNLLSDDGALCMSIDDNEVHNAIQICNQIFGEENHVATISVINNLRGRNDKENVATAHEFLLIYAKSKFTSYGLPLTPEQLEGYKYEDDDGEKYALRDLRKRGRPDRREDRPKMYFPIFYNESSKILSLSRESEADVEITPKRGDGSDGRWRWGRERVAANLDILHAKYSSKKDRWDVQHRVYLKPKPAEVETDEDDDEDHLFDRTSKSKSFWWGGSVSTDAGTKRVKELIPGIDADYPKSPYLLQKIFEMCTAEGDLICDLFAGYGTTADALSQMQTEERGSRRWLMVQLPEPVEEGKAPASLPNIASIARERIRRANGQLETGLGFRSFYLSNSAFHEWHAPSDVDLPDLLDQIDRHTKQLDDVDDETVLFEILLKDGFDLSTKVESYKIGTTHVFGVACGALLICLERKLTKDIIDALADLAETKDAARVVCLDAGFQGNDQLKTNAVQTFKSRLGHGEDGSIFRTV